MPNRSSKRKKAAAKKKARPKDVNALAHQLVGEATGQEDDEPDDDGKNPAAVVLGKLGGKKGGPARAAALSKARRSEIARKAARARWKKAKKKRS